MEAQRFECKQEDGTMKPKASLHTTPSTPSGCDVSLSVKRIHRMEGEGTLKAFCDLAIGDAFLIKGIRVMTGKNGLFVSLPREQAKDGEWYGTVIPLSKEVYQKVSQVVLEAYQGSQALDEEESQ
jgi:stage V sporulation protein G